MLLVDAHRVNQVFTGLAELIPIAIFTNKYCVLSQTSFAYFFAFFDFTFPLLQHFKYDGVLLETACFIPFEGLGAE